MFGKKTTGRFTSWTLLSVSLSFPAWAWSPLKVESLKNPILAFEDAVTITYPKSNLEFVHAQVKEQSKLPLEKLSTSQLSIVTASEWRILKQHLSMENVRKLASKHSLEKGSFHPVCLKKVSSYMPKGAVESFYLEGVAPQLLQFRREVWRLYLTQGGKAEDFVWKRWKPYVLVGTTSKSLHDEDQPHREKDVPCLTTVTAPENNLPKPL